MSNKQLLYLYQKCKEQWEANGKNMLYDEDRIMNLCNYGEALTFIMDQNGLSIDTNHGGPKYDNEQDAMVIKLVEADKTDNVIGEIILGYNAISVRYITKKENSFAEAYSTIVFNGEYTSGTISKITDNLDLVSANLNKGFYLIDGEQYPYASTSEIEKIAEVSNAIDIASQKNKSL